MSVCSIYTSTTLASLRVASLYRTCTLFGHLPTSRTLRTATNTLTHAAKHPHSCNTLALPFLFLSQRVPIIYSPCQSFCTQNTQVNLSNFYLYLFRWDTLAATHCIVLQQTTTHYLFQVPSCFLFSLKPCQPFVQRGEKRDISEMPLLFLSLSSSSSLTSHQLPPSNCVGAHNSLL